MTVSRVTAILTVRQPSHRKGHGAILRKKGYGRRGKTHLSLLPNSTFEGIFASSPYGGTDVFARFFCSFRKFSHETADLPRMKLGALVHMLFLLLGDTEELGGFQTSMGGVLQLVRNVVIN